MRTIQETEQEQADTEITLGMKSLLGVFFGLVIICGIFFGLGYSLGRGSSSSSKQITASTARPAAPKPVTRPPTVTPVDEDDTSNAKAYTPGPDDREPQSTTTAPASTPKPSAGVIKPVIPERDEAASPVTKPDQTAASLPATTSATRPSTTSASMSTPALATQDAAPYSSAPAMVQIAAVSRQEDADVLVAALKKRGYNGIIRKDSKDNLLHVQIGPFATRDEAKAMRTKLIADGYNAILK
jgi:DedD protein